MGLKDDLLRAAAYIGATNDSPDDEASISAVEGDRIAGVLRDLAARAVQPAPGLSDLIPPSAAEWFAEAPGIANHDWRGGWDACRNRIHTLVDERTRGVQAVAPTLPQSLLDLIGDYGMARTDGVSDVERLHRWQLLIDGIKAYALGVAIPDGSRDALDPTRGEVQP